MKYEAGMKIRSYDFESRVDCYYEGVIISVGPVPELPPDYELLHVRATNRVWVGKSAQPEELVFYVHPGWKGIEVLK